jgi:hypothetical protein
MNGVGTRNFSMRLFATAETEAAHGNDASTRLQMQSNWIDARGMP